jgi:preprotein translocase subunit YajC
MFDPSFLLLAQEAPAPAGGGAQEFGVMLTWILPMIILFYFLMIRPQQKLEQKRRQMIDALKPGDRVLTSAGLYGTVVRIDPERNRIVLRCDEVQLTFTRASISEVLSPPDKDKDKKAKEKVDEAA